jgi:hypothetical protein
LRSGTAPAFLLIPQNLIVADVFTMAGKIDNPLAEKAEIASLIEGVMFS